jgi:hypothetical protein
LVVGAASAGYSTTQRFVTPTAAEPSEAARPRVSHAALASALPVMRPSQQVEPARESRVAIEREPSGDLAHSAQPRTASVPQAAARATALPNASARKRTGASVVQEPQQPTEAADAELAAAAAASLAEASRTERIAERVRALDIASHAEPAATPEEDSAASAAVAAVLRAHSEQEDSSSSAAARAGVETPARQTRALAKSPAPAPLAQSAERAVETKIAPSVPLTAAAKIDGLSVRGPLSAASVRRSVERVRPTLSECYSDAAQRAGHNRFAPVRVQVTIDEAGRVKTLPKVDGAQLPGFGDCLSTALSKLVCQAPDTGTARASITLGFVPERL